jgi:hypothetical protein
MKLIIAGSRGFSDYNLLKQKLDYLLKNEKQVEIVSGTANGADKLGEQYAKGKGYSIKQFPADWGKYGKKAGYIRNKQMAEYGTHCVCFWDGKSSGTRLMIRLCAGNKVPCRVVYFY